MWLVLRHVETRGVEMARPRTSTTRTATASSKAPVLADKPATARAAARTCFRHILTSGLFGLPANAQSVDWMVLNDSPIAQTIRVTVFKVGVGAKAPVVPGTLTLALAPNAATHNANNVGLGKPFVPGFYYEVVVEVDDHRVLPSVHVWQDHGNTVIPGTLISPGTFVEV
jgi:hypothetical protein